MTPHEAVTEVLRSITEKAKVGVNLLELEHQAEVTMQILNLGSANKGYQPKWANTPFPSVVCLGVNDVITHPIPKSYVLKDGDLLHIDCGIVSDDMCGDAGLTIPIGTIQNKDERLLRYAKRALYAGIKAVRAGVKITAIGDAIERKASEGGFVTNRIFLGHGIGKTMHEGISFPHYSIPPKQKREEVRPGKFKWVDDPVVIPVLESGTTICIEPMLTYKDYLGYKDRDGWTIRTRDRQKSAFFEHMVKVLDDGYQILTTHIKEEDV